MDKLTGGQVLVRCLEQHGVRHIFGIPGDVTVPIYEALQKSKINHITTRHEQGAGFMADGYARASRQPGIAVVISGPGVTNIATAMGEAYTDSVPLLVLSADVATTSYGKQADFNHEISDQQSLTAAICAQSIRIQSIKDIPISVNDAFEHFRIRWPQTIHIGIPTDILEESDLVDIPSFTQTPAAVPGADQIQKSVDILRGADSPIMILGGGSYRARHLTPKLAECIGASVVTTMNGKDSFPNDHELYLGAGFHFSSIVDAVNNSDAILAVGTQFGRSDFAAVSAMDLLPQYAARQKPLIRADVTRTQLHANIPATVELLGDSKTTITILLEKITIGKESRSRAPTQRIKKEVEKQARELGENYEPWLKAVRKSLPNEGIIAIDSTLIAYLGFPFIDIPTEGSWLYPSAFGTLGYSLPAAIGAKIAQPDRPAIAIIGDGGFLFTCTELLTAVENDIGLPVLVWNDRGFGTIRMNMKSRGMLPLGVNFSIPDLTSVAKGFGSGYENPKTPDELANCIQVALEKNSPTIIEVIDE